MNIYIKEVSEKDVTITWDSVDGADCYKVYWSDHETAEFLEREVVAGCEYTLNKATHVNHFLKVEALKETVEQNLESLVVSEVVKTPIKKVFHPQLESLNRGLVAIPAKNGIFLSWRLFVQEVDGYNKTGLTGADFAVYRNGEKIAIVSDSTNYLDEKGCKSDSYCVAPVVEEKELEKCRPVTVWDKEYLDIPLCKPEGGVTPAGQSFEYNANDMSVGDVDGDGEYEYIVKWDPSNSHDVSHKGYTGKCFLDCYKLDGQLLWRLDMGVNIRAGAHYTQFMVYDFNQDGKAEMAVKTAPGTKMTTYHKDGSVKESFYITLPEGDVSKGVTHQDNYVCSAEDYYNHIVELFMNWESHPEVMRGQWPATLEECFGIPVKYNYPLSEEDAKAMADYFIDEYALSRSAKNELRMFEGFIYEGPEYLTMFAGDGRELQTIPFKFSRVDDGLMWGDYAMARIEPCNRVDRFLSGVAYLDGERPYLLMCRGYYTRTTIVAYDFFENEFREYFSIDSGFVPMDNPFNASHIHDIGGADPVNGILAGQGNHSLSTADVDGDGCMEIIYGGAVIDHDGSVLYSSFDYRPDGVYTKLGHGDAMHVAKINPDRPGLQIFNVFEGGAAVPYGYALRDAETGKVLFGEYATKDLGRCMIGKIDKNTRGLQVWVNDVFDCSGNKMDVPVLGTNQSIRWAADLTTQVIDSPVYLGTIQRGIVNDNIHGVLLEPEGTMTNNGTKGNPGLVADIFGDFREELLLRTEDSSAIRIYMNTDITEHKLFTLMHDTQYRCSIAWQNNCYNQPGYTSFYYGSDMDFGRVLLGRAEK